MSCFNTCIRGIDGVRIEKNWERKYIFQLRTFPVKKSKGIVDDSFQKILPNNSEIQNGYFSENYKLLDTLFCIDPVKLEHSSVVC